MGLFRKMTSLSTLGAVDFKSDKERTASYTKAAAKEAKEQTRLLRAQAAQQAAEARAAKNAQMQTATEDSRSADARPAVAEAAQAPQLPPAGWYADRSDPSMDRWFDGTQWTEFCRPRQP
jgi:hypothetical protein